MVRFRLDGSHAELLSPTAPAPVPAASAARDDSGGSEADGQGSHPASGDSRSAEEGGRQEEHGEEGRGPEGRQEVGQEGGPAGREKESREAGAKGREEGQAEESRGRQAASREEEGGPAPPLSPRLELKTPRSSRGVFAYLPKAPTSQTAPTATLAQPALPAIRRPMATERWRAVRIARAVRKANADIPAMTPTPNVPR